MKAAADVLDAIVALEAAHDVESWRLEDIDLWPTYRVELFMSFTLALLAADAASAAPPRWRRIARRAAQASWKVPMAAWRDRRMNARVERGVAAVLLSDGVSFTCLDGSWFERIVDPLVMALHARGLGTLKLTPQSEPHVPRRLPSRFVQPALDRVKLLATLRPARPELPGFDAFHADATRCFGRHAPSRDWLAAQASRLERLACWFERVMRTTGASHAFVNNYYSIEGMAFVQAARRAGLVAADLQHGLQGPHHVAYGRWSRVPTRGWSTLPHEFWVWGDEEAAAIEAWRGTRTEHRPRITGNLWRDGWRDGTDPDTRRYFERARALRDAPDRPQALVCLSWGLADEETDKLIDAARRCGDAVGWWWRLHPVEARRASEVAARLARHGVRADHVRDATELPLYALLACADFALAHSSTILQEAEVFGIPSIITSSYGAQIHHALVERGSAVLATDGASIAAAALDLVERPRRVRAAPSAAHVPRLDALVDALFPATAAACVQRATA